MNLSESSKIENLQNKQTKKPQVYFFPYSWGEGWVTAFFWERKSGGGEGVVPDGGVGCLLSTCRVRGALPLWPCPMSHLPSLRLWRNVQRNEIKDYLWRNIFLEFSKCSGKLRSPNVTWYFFRMRLFGGQYRHVVTDTSKIPGSEFCQETMFSKGCF